MDHKETMGGFSVLMAAVAPLCGLVLWDREAPLVRGANDRISGDC